MLELNLRAVFREEPSNTATAPSWQPPETRCWPIAHCSHQCTFQALPAALALLAFCLTYLASTSTSMKSEEVVEESKEASFILTLSASIAVLSVRVAAWQTQLRRHLWLQQFDVLEATR